MCILPLYSPLFVSACPTLPQCWAVCILHRCTWSHPSASWPLTVDVLPALKLFWSVHSCDFPHINVYLKLGSGIPKVRSRRASTGIMKQPGWCKVSILPLGKTKVASWNGFFHGGWKSFVSSPGIQPEDLEKSCLKSGQENRVRKENGMVGGG